MRHFPESGYQFVEFLGAARRRDAARVGSPVRFHDRADAARFLRRVAPDDAGMAALRALAVEEADSVLDSLATDGEVIDVLAARLCSGALRVEVTRHPRLHPIGGHVDEPEEKREAAPEKRDQDVEFEITDLWGEPYKDLEWVLTYPDGKTKKTGKLGADGIVKQSTVPAGGYHLAFKIVSAARWGDSRVEVGKEVKLFATAAGFDPGASGKFEIFCANGPDRKPIAKVDGKVNTARVLEGAWTPDEEAVKGVRHGALLFRAKMGASQATSSRVPVVQKHTIDLQTDEGPLPDTMVHARFSDGHEEAVKSKDGKVDLLVPIGQTLCWLDLPELPGAHITLEPDEGEPREYVIHSAPAQSAASAAPGEVDEDEGDEDDEEDESEPDEGDDEDDEDEDDEVSA